jgi:hypothetical protein
MRQQTAGVAIAVERDGDDLAACLEGKAVARAAHA